MQHLHLGWHAYTLSQHTSHPFLQLTAQLADTMAESPQYTILCWLLQMVASPRLSADI
jgi:hypothetical protein